MPQCPGVYEWGALRHHCNFPEDIIAFYVGKAGTHFAGRGQATLASRFMRCDFTACAAGALQTCSLVPLLLRPRSSKR